MNAYLNSDITASHDQPPVGEPVVVRSTLDNSWAGGFDLHQIVNSQGVRKAVLKRRSDGALIGPIPVRRVKYLES